MVGIDGSEASLEAVDWAVDEAVRHDVPLHLVHAAAPNDEALGLIAVASERSRKGIPAVPLSSEVLHEGAASALVSNGRNAFALVLGPRGLGDLAGLLLGSVSYGRRRARHFSGGWRSPARLSPTVPGQ
ncbi:universal stress protein [Streptomyces sp. NPDC057565]|uniref:universal stress protein n=1 Tax=Streptomyces sp. NPDC057565 TaxID=3346169 RepID=UPI0036C2F91C